MSEVINPAEFDFFTEALICERAYEDYWNARRSTKRERKAERKYCMRLGDIKKNFSILNHVVEAGDARAYDIMFVARETGRNLLRIHLETPFFISGLEDANSDGNQWAQVLPPDSGITLDVAYVNIGVGALPISEGRSAMSPVSVIGLGLDVRQAEPKAAAYSVPLSGNQFSPVFRSFN